MIRAITFLKAGLVTLGGFAGLAAADRVDAAQYGCQVPLAVLCPGCAANVTITLQPRGGCRVSFSPAPSGASPPPSGAVTLQIEISGAAGTSRRLLPRAPRRATASNVWPALLCVQRQSVLRMTCLTLEDPAKGSARRTGLELHLLACRRIDDLDCFRVEQMRERLFLRAREAVSSSLNTDPHLTSALRLSLVRRSVPLLNATIVACVACAFPNFTFPERFSTESAPPPTGWIAMDRRTETWSPSRKVNV